MPGNVANASPSGTLPPTLFTSFEESNEWQELQNQFHDGSILRYQLALTARRTFKLAKKLMPADVATVYTLWLSNGNTVPFTWQNPIDLSVITVVFGQVSWGQTVGMPRSVLDMTLREVA